MRAIRLKEAIADLPHVVPVGQVCRVEALLEDPAQIAVAVFSVLEGLKGIRDRQTDRLIDQLIEESVERGIVPIHVLGMHLEELFQLKVEAIEIGPNEISRPLVVDRGCPIGG